MPCLCLEMFPERPDSDVQERAPDDRVDVVASVHGPSIQRRPEKHAEAPTHADHGQKGLPSASGKRRGEHGKQNPRLGSSQKHLSGPPWNRLRLLVTCILPLMCLKQKSLLPSDP